MQTDPPRSGECLLCGRRLQPPTVETPDGVFCSTGCRDVHATLGGAEPRSDAVETGGTDVGSNESRNSLGEDAIRTFLRIDGMYSATCERFLESVAEKRDGVIEAQASYVTETIRVTHDRNQITKARLREVLSTLGYTAYLREDASGVSQTSGNATRRSREMNGIRKRRDEQLLDFRFAAGLLFGAFLIVPYVTILYPIHLAAVFDWETLRVFEETFRLSGQGALLVLQIYFVLTGIVLVFTGLPVLRGAYISLKMRRPNTDLLVAITALSAYAYSTIAVLLTRLDIYFDLAVVVTASVTAAVFYESSVKRRALDRLTELTVSQVDTARVYAADGTTSEVDVGELAPDDVVLVRQGERVPVEGELVESSCSVDEAIVTGESLPVRKQPGDDVIGGSIVTDGAALVRVGTDAASSIDRITTAVWDLQSATHSGQRHADRLASRAVLLVAAAALVLGGATVWTGGADSVDGFLLFLLAFLAGSPWALGLATPLSVASSLEQALRRGIVVFDETMFERLRDVDVVVFDKTGTLTTGEMGVIEADAPPDLLAAAAELERRASHPAAKAIVDAFAHETELRGSTRPDGNGTDGTREAATGDVTAFDSHSSGIEGNVGGTQLLVGDLDLFREENWGVPADVEARVVDAREAGRLPVVVGRGGTAEGVVVLGDEPREGWEETVRRLDENGTDVVVLTGDGEAATGTFSRHESVTHVFAGVPPDGKTATLRRLKSRGVVAMVGDGTNDAPALAAADLGICQGGGTALAADPAALA
ncbi:MAG: HAD-IC family P-type ATPase, partial [Haloferacaceae archaeon]